MRFVYSGALVFLIVLALPLGAQRLTESDQYIYAMDSEGRTLAPLTPLSGDARKLISLFEKHPPVTFARADNLYSYLPMGDMQYLVTTNGSHPRMNGIFLANLGADLLTQMIYADYKVKEARDLPNLGKWFLIESSGGLHGTAGTALTAIVVMRTANGKTSVSAQDLVAVSWDMEEGLCGSRLKEGKGGDIGLYELTDVKRRPAISIEVTEQDCQSRKIEHKTLRFVLRGTSFEPERLGR
jgi:hypothetical protein